MSELEDEGAVDHFAATVGADATEADAASADKGSADRGSADEGSADRGSADEVSAAMATAPTVGPETDGASGGPETASVDAANADTIGALGDTLGGRSDDTDRGGAFGGGPASNPIAPDATHADVEGYARYERRDQLGIGGMGEVLLCHDRRVGRDVALKVIRDDGNASGEMRRRFEREARVQAQLEHPSIVPVHDLGARPEGGAYFTMKRVRGRTLEEILAALRAGDEETTSEFSRRRLLGAFSQACLAVAYANARGVVHRDLKPANVIIGDFGELYVLDWGIAKVLGEAEEEFFEGDSQSEGETLVGALMGTPGYMAPEQARGDADLDAGVDVYALGMILFELLTLERFHHGETAAGLLTSTLTEGPAHPAQRAPDRAVPVELDALCAKATALDRTMRMGGARALHAGVEAFLAGDRDAEQRRSLAAQHVQRATEALARGRSDVEQDIDARTEAVRELFAAVALDPDNVGAKRAMVAALTEAQPELPEAAREELETLRSAQRRRAARNAALGLSMLYALVPFVLWNGVRDWMALGSMVGALSAAVAMAAVISRAGRVSIWPYLALMTVLCVFIASTGSLFGPFFVTPALALACSVALIAGARIPVYWRATVITMGILAAGLPGQLELLGVLDSSYALASDGALRLLPEAMAFSNRTGPTLLAMSIATILLPCMLVGRSVAVLHRAEEQQFAQAWRLRQIFPAS